MPRKKAHFAEGPNEHLPSVPVIALVLNSKSDCLLIFQLLGSHHVRRETCAEIDSDLC